MHAILAWRHRHDVGLRVPPAETSLSRLRFARSRRRGGEGLRSACRTQTCRLAELRGMVSQGAAPSVSVCARLECAGAAGAAMIRLESRLKLVRCSDAVVPQ